MGITEKKMETTIMGHFGLGCRGAFLTLTAPQMPES